MKAKEFDVSIWVDGEGNKIEKLRLQDFANKFKVIFCFQSWCPGCHSIGFPNLQKMVNALSGNDEVVFLAIQTVFEGFEENTFSKVVELQKKYDLKIPFGHDAGEDGHTQSVFMKNYQTGGTPWFVFIDQQDNIVFADFHLHVDNAIAYLQQQTEV